jgi:hypothetical protein
LGPGGVRSVVAESVLIKQQLLIRNRSRQRAPIYALQIVWLPACVLLSFALPARSVQPSYSNLRLPCAFTEL